MRRSKKESDTIAERSATFLFLFRRPFEDGFAGGEDFIGTADRRRVRGLVQKLGGFTHDFVKRVREGVQCFFRFGFRRLHHHCFGHHEREVNRRGMKAKIQQPFGDVHRGDVFFGLQILRGSDELVHAQLAAAGAGRMSASFALR